MAVADVKSLCDFLAESELQQYYNAIKNELKISTVSHLKYASDEDLKQIGLSRPEIRRLRKFYEKYYPNGYLGKIKRLLQNPKPADMFHTSTSWQNSDNYTNKVLMDEGSSKAPPSNKHIIPADSITINKQLGVGEFGIVQQGVWTINGNERLQVAIKCLCRMQSNPIEFLKEAAIMHAIEHENIVRFYGVVLDTESLMLVTELAPLRSLLECLKDSGLKVSFLTVPTLCEFAMQICNGMTYLENKRLIHRDLAARNILVFNKDKVKISDFGLSRSLGVGKDYYQTNFNINLKLPIAWCAPECINFLRFTNASDVWGYGVCLWEMFSYGFQPWAALTGHQILEAIDEPNFQRLDPPDCCPKEYYALMLKCWQHDPLKRPRFVDIYAMLPDLRPEQVKTIAAQDIAKKDHLLYRQNEIITVLDKESNAPPLWRGVLNTGKTGLFNPANTVTYLSNIMLPSMNNPFTRTFERGSKRRLRSEMISKPQNDLKHTGHIGIDGAFFGDISFLTSPSTPPASSSIVPRQVVTPYKPSEDIEQTPLLTPTSPDSVQTNGNYFPSGAGGAFQQHSDGTSFVSRFDFTNPFQQLGCGGGKTNGGGVFEGENGGAARSGISTAQHHHQQQQQPAVSGDVGDSGGRHEYHEISDEEVMAPDLGLSLTDEMEQMFQSMSTTSRGGGVGATSASYDHTNKQNEAAEMKGAAAAKLNLPLNCSSLYKTKKKAAASQAGTVKPLSMKDDKILSHAIEIANEISARSMNDLVQDPSSSSAQSPRRKFSFKFPLGHGHHAGGGGMGHDQSRSLDESGSHYDAEGGDGRIGGFSNKFGASGRHFSDELKNVTDIQYNRMSTSECFEKSMEILKKPINLGAPLAACSDSDTSFGTNYDMKKALDSNLVDIENKLKALNMDFHEKCSNIDKNNSSETLFGPGPELERFDLTSFKLGLPLKYNKTSKNLSRELDQLFGPGRGDKINRALGHETTTTATDKSRKYHYGLSGSGYSNCPSEYEFNTRLVDGGSFYESVKLPHSAKTFRGSDELYNSAEVRQRSLSFTEKSGGGGNGGSNVDALLRQSMSVLKPSSASAAVGGSGANTSTSGRSTLSRKSKSFKARTLRRLSYNPAMMLDGSSSSSSGSEMEISALSECDIRTRGSRRRVVMPRRSAGHQDKLMYGSNSSIQSAPHFNYDSMSVLMKGGGGGMRSRGGMDVNNVVGGQQLSDPYNLAQGGRANSGGGAMMKSVFSFDRLGGLGGGGGGGGGGMVTGQHHHQVDLGTSFKWPEKIHASTVKQNDMFWNKCRELKQQQAATRYMDSSSSSSGNTESLTDKHRLAYNSLVEKPSTGAVFKQQLNDMEKSWRNGESARNASMHTLPKAEAASGGPAAVNDCVPTYKPPNLNISDAARNGHRTMSKENLTESGAAGGVCESPSYLTSTTMYSYGADVAGNSSAASNAAANLVPLPPRDRFKPTTLPNQKRHVRKHALIIPATGTLRTLDKLGSNHLSEENRLRLKTVADKSKMDMHTDTNLNLKESKINFSALSKLQVVESAPQSPSSHQIYQNFSMIPEVPSNVNVAADTASLDFETIVERKDLNHVSDMFSLNESSGHLLERSASLIAAGGGGDCDRVDGVIGETLANGGGGGGGGDDANSTSGGGGGAVAAAAEETSVLSNSVSCEDLLEFSEKKPNGRERGAESDEVRIMIKVLGPKMSPEYCLEALDIMKWADVHKAIKIIKLHNLMVEDRHGTLRDQLRLCSEQLENNDWNLQDTAINL